MNRSILAGVLIALVSTVSCTKAPAPLPQEAEAVEADVFGDHLRHAGDELKFGSWPGKKGPLKAGIRFRLADQPGLAGFAVDRDERRASSSSRRPSLTRSLMLKRGGDRLFIDLEVVPDGTDAAQEALLHQVSMTNAQVTLVNLRGEAEGLQVGDVNFVDRGGVASTHRVDFVRNNIRVRVAEGPGRPVDVVALARSIDDEIRKGPDLSREEFRAKAPVIATFEAKQRTMPVLSETALNLKVSDPQGLGLEYQLHANMGWIPEYHRIQPPAIRFLSDNQPETVNFDLVVINEALLFSTARAVLTIK